MQPNYARQVLAMDDDELERFVWDWVSRKTKKYAETQRYSGAGDMGRDVVGFHTAQRHEGPWDNYQCKQLTIRLGESQALVELGKIFYYSSEGNFSLPQSYVFVAPKGVVRGLQLLIDNPSEFKARLLSQWNEVCAEGISAARVPLTPKIRALIKSFDFSRVGAVAAPQMVNDSETRPVLVKWFGEDPGEAPIGVAPDEIQAEETPFVSQLVSAYSERNGQPIENADGALAHPHYGEHLRRQRTRYFDAAAFKRYYRDNTPSEHIKQFENDMHDGVVETHSASHADSLAKVDAVLSQAAIVSPSGVLAKHARVSVKQGICHHFVNEGKLQWKP